MAILVDNMQWVLIACGLLTCSMIEAVLAPRRVMQNYFGETLTNRTADLIVRNWGALVAAGGVFLIYSAFNPAIRPPVLIFIGTGKLVFIALMLMAGKPTRQARLAIIIDGLMIVLFAAYLLATQGSPTA
ncbi:MAG TPA: hypothetical protein PLN33_12600 [Hyphomonadaceae bacterium]|jgi:hypothetical protein|nr:hypothetical protein [Hyphomonadaceae bacterium]